MDRALPDNQLPPGVRIVPAGAADVPVILDLIKELALFEKLAHLVVATETMLEKALFGPHPKAEVVLALVDDEPVGFALYYHNFSTFLGRHGLYLEDLFVREAARGKGVGKALLLHLAAIARERGCGRYEWAVLDWNENAIRFYKQLGAQPLDDWTIMRVAGRELEEIAEK